MRPRFLAVIAPEGAVPDPDMLDRIRRILPCERSFGTARLFLPPGMECIELSHSQGWIIGTLFDRANNARIDALPSHQGLALGSTAGTNLLRGFWGSYAALWHDGHGAVQILRDPSATLPVYRATRSGNHFVMSDVALLVETGILAPELDWAMVRHGLLYAQLPTARTHLKHVHEILPGVRASLREGECSSALLWRPWTFASEPHEARAFADEAGRIEAVVDMCVAAWANCASSVNLELSGGLDSSIVATALARSGRPFTCATIASPGRDGDERDYARVVAAHLGVTLSEIVTKPDDADPLARLDRWTPRPRGMRVIAGLDTLFEGAARDADADTIFSGGGGDNVFCFTGSTAPVLDACVAPPT